MWNGLLLGCEYMNLVFFCHIQTWADPESKWAKAKWAKWAQQDNFFKNFF